MKNGRTRTRKRKQDHLDLFRGRGVSARGQTTWLECVRLLHQALPEMDLAEADISASFAGRTFRAPFFITGMTGGTAKAAAINKTLARVAEAHGIGFGLGSQRAMLEEPRLLATYEVRSAAPDVFLAGNIGGVQAAATPAGRIREMLERIRADALCIHLNPAQEMVQPEGDRTFSGVLDAVATLVRELPVPVIVKETGAGLSRESAQRLKDAGVRHIDVAGAGGTSWVGAEVLRRRRGRGPDFSEFWDWGIPTAAALSEVEGLGLDVIGSGGLRTGLDAAAAIALGATLAGVAAPVIRAYFSGGARSVDRLLQSIEEGLKAAMVLTGSRTFSDLRAVPRVITGDLLEWRRQRAAHRREGDRGC
ncbi:MAG: type 2 isopentenyl-diphosphate Delta-isomerase [Deltaproteobacteria bacterium]|nr:type 2 isopentenyl-diphosphate Delta-isomerase [Deltaproteobacteria bacterium]